MEVPMFEPGEVPVNEGPVKLTGPSFNLPRRKRRRPSATVAVRQTELDEFICGQSVGEIEEVNESMERTKCFELGIVGETYVKQWLMGLPSTLAVRDVRHVPMYRKRDIDFIVLHNVPSPEVKITTVEVKTDQWIERNGTFSYEIWGDEEAGTPGCMEVTDAASLIIYTPQEHAVTVFKTNALRDWVNEYIDTFDKIRSKNVTRHGREYHSLCAKVPFDQAIEHCGGRWVKLPPAQQLALNTNKLKGG